MLQEKRHVIPFDKVFKEEWEAQLQDGSRWIIGTPCFIDSWNLRNTFVPDDGSQSCFKFKMKATQQHEESANLSTAAYLLALKIQELRLLLNTKNEDFSKACVFSSRHWCCFHGHDVNVMLLVFCEPLHNTTCDSLPWGPHDSHDSHDFFIFFPPPQRIAFLKVSEENQGLKSSEPWRWLKQGSSAQHVLAPGSCNRPLQKLRLFTPENSAICLSTIQM